MRRVAALSVAVLLAAGCASRSVREPPSELVDFKPDARVESLWTADIGASSKKQLTLVPAFANGKVFVSDPKGRVSAYAGDSGHEVWQTALNVPISGGTGVGENLVLVATREGVVFALDQESGKLVWRSTVSSEVLAPPAASRGMVVVQTIDGKMFGLTATDGKRAWVYDRTEPALSLHGTSAPVITSDVVLSGFASGKLAVLQLQDGRALWELPVTQPRGRNEIERLVDVDAPPLVLGDMLFAASYQGKLIAVNVRTGSIAWSRDVSTYSGLAADKSHIFLTDELGQVLAFDQRTGSSAWKQDKLRGRGLNAPVYIDDLVVVGDAEGYVHWLSAEDGHFVARYRVARGPIRARGALAIDTLYIVAADTLAALRVARK